MSLAEAAAWKARGQALAEAGDHAAALASFTRALGLCPGDVDALIGSGHALRAQRRGEEALHLYAAVLRHDSRSFDAWFGRACVLLDMRQPAEAIEACDRALEARSGSPEAWLLRGDALYRLGHFEEALAACDRAATLPARVVDGFSAEVHTLRGDALRRLERFAEAVAEYDKAVALWSGHVRAWNHRGIALRELGEQLDAMASHDAALRLDPQSVDAFVNRSAALRMLGRDEEALADAECALALAPDSDTALTSVGNCLRALGRVSDALRSFEQAASRSREPASARLNHGLCLLLSGDLARGWPEYEARWQTPDMAASARRFGRPLWLGQGDLAGRTILLHAEQGLGDTIQFCRYAPMVAAMGATVLLAVPSALRSLLDGLDAPVEVVDPTRHMPSFDVHCPLMSLPLAFGTELASIPCRVPYLAPSPERRALWRERLGCRSGLRVGLAWSGSAEHKEGWRRTVPLETMAPLGAAGVELYCLQRDLRQADVPAMATLPQIRFFGHMLEDFSDTAALIGELDLVISVDTSVLHLAGAMARPVWGLLPFAPDWRWMLQREDSPWYPTMRLFRQPRPGDWGSVIAGVCNELRQFGAQT